MIWNQHPSEYVGGGYTMADIPEALYSRRYWGSGTIHAYSRMLPDVEASYLSLTVESAAWAYLLRHVSHAMRVSGLGYVAIHDITIKNYNIDQGTVSPQPQSQGLTEKPPSILAEAREIIYGDREQTYGHPSKNLELIAKYWSEHLGQDIAADDVCVMMILVKLARLKNQPTHRDSLVDVCGYAALIERVHDYNAQKDKETPVS